MIESLKATKKEIVTAFRTREILAAARSLLEQRGPEAMTMEEIAAAAGVAKGTLYLYFQSKDDLILALITRAGENIIRDVEASLKAPGTPPERLIRMVTVLLEYLNRERLLFPIYARELSRGEEESREGFRRSYLDLEEQFVTLVTRLFAEGIAADYDAKGRLAGIEILDALKRFGDPLTLKKVTLEEIGKQLRDLEYIIPYGIMRSDKS